MRVMAEEWYLNYLKSQYGAKPNMALPFTSTRGNSALIWPSFGQQAQFESDLPGILAKGTGYWGGKLGAGPSSGGIYGPGGYGTNINQRYYPIPGSEGVQEAAKGLAMSGMGTASAGLGASQNFLGSYLPWITGQAKNVFGNLGNLTTTAGKGIDYMKGVTSTLGNKYAGAESDFATKFNTILGETKTGMSDAISNWRTRQEAKYAQAQAENQKAFAKEWEQYQNTLGRGLASTMGALQTANANAPGTFNMRAGLGALGDRYAMMLPQLTDAQRLAQQGILAEQRALENQLGSLSYQSPQFLAGLSDQANRYLASLRSGNAQIGAGLGMNIGQAQMQLPITVAGLQSSMIPTMANLANLYSSAYQNALGIPAAGMNLGTGYGGVLNTTGNNIIYNPEIASIPYRSPVTGYPGMPYPTGTGGTGQGLTMEDVIKAIQMQQAGGGATQLAGIPAAPAAGGFGPAYYGGSYPGLADWTPADYSAFQKNYAEMYPGSNAYWQ